MPTLESDGLAEGSVGFGDRAVRSYRRPLSYEEAVSSSNVAELIERWSYQLRLSTCHDRFPLGWVHPLSTFLQDAQRLRWPMPGCSNTAVFDPQLAQRLASRLDVDRTGALGE